MKVQWYPGHMTKARRMMEEDIKLIDLMIELLDARIPLSSRNPDINTIAKGKSRLILLNKTDLADPLATKEWTEYFRAQGATVVTLDARNRSSVRPVQNAILSACKEKIERDRKRGIVGRPVRAMVAGIPNVGKSTFINSYAGKSCAKTGNKPGVTKGKQWIRLSKEVELLDTPGILWPKFDDETVGTNLALIGSINDQILDTTQLAYEFIGMLQKSYPGMISERYHVEENEDCLKVLEEIAKIRGCLKKGEELDLTKTSNIILDEFRAGKIGAITLERPGK